MIVHPRALLLVIAAAGTASAWTTPSVALSSCLTQPRRPFAVTPRLFATPDEPSAEEELAAVDVDDLTFESEEQKKEVVGNLVADDEWEGLTLELTDLVRKSCTSLSSIHVSDGREVRMLVWFVFPPTHPCLSFLSSYSVGRYQIECP